MRRTARCSAAAGSTAPFTAQPGPSCWKNVGPWADAIPGGPRSPAAMRYRPSTSFTRSGRCGTAAVPVRKTCWHLATVARSPSRISMSLRRSPFRRSRPAFIASRPILRRASRPAPWCRRFPPCRRRSSAWYFAASPGPRPNITSRRSASLGWGESISALRLGVEPGDPAFEAGLRGRIALEHDRIVPRYDVPRRDRKLAKPTIALKRLGDIVNGRKNPAAIEVRVEVRGVSREHDGAEPCVDPNALQAFGVAADVVHAHTGGDQVVAVVKLDPARKHLAHHCNHVVGLERVSDRVVAHRASGCVFHFAVLQVIARARKQVVVAAVIVVQMADDDGLDVGGIDADRSKTFHNRLHGPAAATRADGLVEPSIDQYSARLADDRPDEIVERHVDVVGIATEKVLRGFARMVTVANGVDFVSVAHATLPALRRRHGARAVARSS